MRRIYFLLSLSLFLSHGIARAGIVDIALQFPLLSGSPGDVLAFFGTITNTIDSQVYLNADNFNGIPPGNIDDSPFFANTPNGYLDPLGSTGLIELFDVTVPDSISFGNFEILGGATSDDQTVIGSVDFTVLTPEPTSMAFMLVALAAVCVIKLLPWLANASGIETQRAGLPGAAPK